MKINNSENLNKVGDVSVRHSEVIKRQQNNSYRASDWCAYAGSQVARLAGVSFVVSSGLMPFEAVVDSVNRNHMGIKKPKYAGIHYVLIKVVASYRTKLVAASNKNGVRHGSEKAQEHDSLTREGNTSVNKKYSYIKFAGVTAIFAGSETLFTAKSSLNSVHATEALIFNKDFVVPQKMNIKQVDSIESLVKYARRNFVGSPGRAFKNGAQIIMYPVCYKAKELFDFSGLGSVQSTLAASFVTGLAFSPAINIFGMIYRKQAINMDPNSFKSISFMDAFARLPKEFIQKSVWGRPAASKAVLNVAALSIVYSTEQVMDNKYVPLVHGKIKNCVDSVADNCLEIDSALAKVVESSPLLSRCSMFARKNKQGLFDLGDSPAHDAQSIKPVMRFGD